MSNELLAAQVCVMRHGETHWNVAGILQGWSDVRLNELGRVQAREMAVHFADAGFVAVCSSPLLRALESAQIMAKALDLPAPWCHEGLRERHFGAIQGVPKSELAETNPALLQQILRRAPATHFEGGESMDEFAERIFAALVAIGERHAGERVLVVTHGWVMDVITRHIHHQPRQTILPVKRKNGEFLWLRVRADEIKGDETGISSPQLTG